MAINKQGFVNAINKSVGAVKSAAPKVGAAIGSTTANLIKHNESSIKAGEKIVSGSKQMVARNGNRMLKYSTPSSVPVAAKAAEVGTTAGLGAVGYAAGVGALAIANAEKKFNESKKEEVKANSDMQDLKVKAIKMDRANAAKVKPDFVGPQKESVMSRVNKATSTPVHSSVKPVRNRRSVGPKATNKGKTYPLGNKEKTFVWDK